ncbi:MULTISPECIES: HEAT repeat domain-containing protein [unclassified Microcoleus]|uniref:HEAT repeat domain-containing protein n=1 Tax=unclassified Microcoleus TaxID=2642155 RepID=UPI002FCE7594
MEKKQLLDLFECVSNADDSEAGDDLENAVRQAGVIGVTVIFDNLKLGRYLKDSIWLCQRLGLQESIPLVRQHLISNDQMVKIAAAIALTKLDDRTGLLALKQMVESGEVPSYWLEVYGISQQSLSNTDG